jgi:hypothetical protein
MRKVGAQGESVAHSRSSMWSGTRMARVQTTECRLMFSIVVRFSMASCIELRDIPPAKKANIALLGVWSVLVHGELNSGRHSQSNTNRPVGIGASGLKRC